MSNYKEKTDLDLQKESNVRVIRKLVLHRKNVRRMRFDLENNDRAEEELNFLLTQHERQWQEGLKNKSVFRIDYDKLTVHQVELPSGEQK